MGTPSSRQISVGANHRGTLREKPTLKMYLDLFASTETIVRLPCFIAMTGQVASRVALDKFYLRASGDRP
jgi:hypothetical protein